MTKLPATHPPDVTLTPVDVAGFVPNASDDEGRYSIGAQAGVGRFNLGKLLAALRPVLTEEQREE